ncbi:MAG TPA: SGNH/GDSL hydrolase family protein [Blastocatellia bacterium]|nr:SGNH/GDSL hydrolase family protein [Blastocatellia bacterium]
MKHLVLLGDSVFDNKAYINDGLDVIAHIRRQIPADWKASLRAVDGSVIENVRKQVLDLPNDATHLIISVGGNDAILNADVLRQKVASSAEALDKLADVAGEFEYHYREMLQSVLRLKKPTVVCTIYYPRIPEPFIQKIAVAALTIFNDVIIRQAFQEGVPLIDLRLVCNEDSDYANEIEPSEKGGGKIAKAIVRVVNEHNFESGRTEVFV